jgi:hypothetical protein
MAIRVRGGNSRARSYPPAVVTGPTITSSASVSVAEGTALAHQLKADEVVTWSKVGGADTALFTLSASGGTLTMTAKDYETPADANTDNAYVVNVRATDRNGRVANQTVTVTVTDVDEVPTAFTFTDITGATIATVYTSNSITVAGLAAASPISIVGGTYAKNAGSYVSTPGTVVNGDTITVRVTSSADPSTAVSAVLTIGGVSDTYTVTTAA